MGIATFWVRWIRATFLGWVLGVPIIILLALLGEMVGIGGAQVLVGAGMGAGVGLMQLPLIGAFRPRRAPWFWSSTIGLSLPFLVGDVGKLLGRELPYSLYVCVAVGGLIVGVWQAYLLRARFRALHWWVVSSLIGWSGASAAAALADQFPKQGAISGVLGLLIYLFVLIAGGLVLGLCTGAALIRLPPRR